jgi:hypothetical protein
LVWSLTGVVGLAVAVGLWVIPALGDGPVTVETGTLRLHLNSDGDKVIFDPIAPGADVVQTLSQSKCKLTSSGASLVGFSAAATQANKNPYPGLKDHRIGVGQTGEGNGEPCARINRDLGQELTLALTGALQSLAVDYAEIDLGFKFDGDAILVLKRGAVVVDTITVPCNGFSDCGPDSGGSDNERVILYLTGTTPPGPGHWQSFPIAGAFDSITIKPGTAASAGSVSLEAGFGGSPPGPVGAALGTNDTLLEVVEAFEGEIDCGETEIIIESENATFQTTRGFDTNGGCKGPEDGLLFSFEAGTDGDELFVDFITEPVDSLPATVAQFVEVITWRFATPPNVSGGEAQLGTLSYDDHVGAGKRVMPWCLKDPRVGGSLPAPINPATVLPAGHTSCLLESEGNVTFLGDFVKVDVVYNIGDGKRWSN